MRPWWRLSIWYFCHFATVGLLLPYLAPWLAGLGYGAVQIGVVFGILGLTGVIAPNLWGWLADTSGHRLALIRVATACAVLGFALVAWAQAFWFLALAMLVFGCFRNAALPQFEALTFEHLRGQTQRYASVRLWGSVGFILVVTAAGAWFDVYGLWSFPIWMLGTLGLAWLASLLVAAPGPIPAAEDHISLREVLHRPQAWVLLAVSFLQQASHGPFYAFFSLHLSAQGYSATVVGLLWALGVLAEIAVFVFMPRLLDRYSDRHLIQFALLFTALRWLLTGWFAASMPLIVFAQLLHGVSFGVFHAAAIHRIHQLFQGRARGRGQALYSSLSFGAGVALGSFLAGLAWDGVGAGWVFTAAAACTLLALLYCTQLPKSLK